MEEEAVRLGEAVKQFSVFLENKAGELLSVVRLLNDAKVEVLGLSVQDSIDATMVRMVVSDPETVETIFMERGIPYGCMDLVVVQLPGGSTNLSRILSSLLVAEVNLHFSYPLLVHPEDKAVLALCTEDREIASHVLIKNGFKVLYQDDLSR